MLQYLHIDWRLPCGTEFLRDLIFAIRKDWFFVPGKSIQLSCIFSNSTTVCDLKPVFVLLYTALFLNERENWTATVSITVFLWSKFKLFVHGSLSYYSGKKRNNCVPDGSASKEIQYNQNCLMSHTSTYTSTSSSARQSSFLTLRYEVTLQLLKPSWVSLSSKIYSEKRMLKCICFTDKRISKNLMSHLSA